MPAPKGNTYYKLASRLGRHKQYQPEELWNKFLDYIKWVEDNPLKEEKVFGSGVRMKVNRIRAMTCLSFCIFAEISRQTFENYSNDKDFVDIVSRIRDIIYTQKFEGAAADLLNPNIIARELGLRDQSESEIKHSMKVEVIDQATKEHIEKMRQRLEE